MALCTDRRLANRWRYKLENVIWQLVSRWFNTVSYVINVEKYGGGQLLPESVAKIVAKQFYSHQHQIYRIKMTGD